MLPSKSGQFLLFQLSTFWGAYQIDITEPTTFFKIGFDFENVLIFSNEPDFDELEKIEALFPEDGLSN